LRPAIRVTTSPARRVLAGHSLGAVAALHLSARRPGLFGSVVAGSPALWWPGGNGQISGAGVAEAYARTAPAGYSSTPEPKKATFSKTPGLSTTGW
jgi:enterochelin esterase-like enzyme